MNRTMLDAALGYAQLGLRVFRLQPGTKDAKGLPGWKAAASTDPVTIAKWFSDSEYNLAIVVPEGVVVVDLDNKHDGQNGFESLAALEAMHGKLPMSPVQVSPSCSEHLWFRLPDGVHVRNSAGKVGSGIDIRTSYPEGDGNIKVGMVVAAPSYIEGRSSYYWKQPLPACLDDLPLAPDWLIERARKEKEKPAPSKVDRRIVDCTEPNIIEGRRNDALTQLAGTMRRKGMTHEAIEAALLAENTARCLPPLPTPEVLSIAGSVSGYQPSADVALNLECDEWLTEIEASGNDARALVSLARGITHDEGLTGTERESLVKRCARNAGVSVGVLKRDLVDSDVRHGEVLTVVEIIKSDFAGSTDQAVALLSDVPGLRQRNGELVEVVPIFERNTVAIQTVCAARLGYLLARAARWRYGEGGDGAPDNAVIGAILAQGYWPNVPPLTGLVAQPVILPSGTVIGDSGYQAELMREAVFSPDDYPVYGGTPEEALAEIEGLISEVAFASPIDKAGAIAAILTAATRPTISMAPAFLIRAHDKGSGKSFLSRLIALFATGANCAQPWPRLEDEQGKTIISLLLEGSACVTFDNLPRDWQSAKLAIALTEEIYRDRLLGANKMLEASTASLWIANGNQVKAIGDLARRVITINLDPRCEKPWQRQFVRDPIAEVRANRGAWVMKALAIVEAGMGSQPVSPWGFPDWDRMIRATILHFGFADPVLSVSDNQDHDPDRELLGDFSHLWAECFGNEILTLKDIETITRNAGVGTALAALRYLMEEIALEKGELNLRKMGIWLASFEGVITGGFRFMGAGDRTRTGKPWVLQNV